MPSIFAFAFPLYYAGHTYFCLSAILCRSYLLLPFRYTMPAIFAFAFSLYYAGISIFFHKKISDRNTSVRDDKIAVPLCFRLLCQKTDTADTSNPLTRETCFHTKWPNRSIVPKTSLRMHFLTAPAGIAFSRWHSLSDALTITTLSAQRLFLFSL